MNMLEFAINMEMEGYKYYLEQALINMNNELHTVFQLLADSEKSHADLLTMYMKKEAFNLNNEFIRPNMKSVFRDMKHFQKENAQKQLDAYRLATVQEEKSIELYREMSDKTLTEAEKDLFEYLIEQEEQHLKLFEDFVIMLTRPDEWVESAEFGIREEY